MSTSYAFKPLTEGFMYETLPQRLKHFAETIPDKIAFVFYSSSMQRTVLTCKELYERSIIFAKGLKELGIKAGDIVALGVSNISEWLVCHFGIIMIGGIVLRLKFASKEEANHVMRKSGKCVMIIFDSGHDRNNDEIVKSFAPKTNDSGEIYNPLINELRYAIHCGNVAHEDFPCTFEDIMLLGTKSELTLEEKLDPDDVCVIQLTSGTTGLPKLIPWSHYFILALSYSFQKATRMESEDIFFDAQPFQGGMGYIFNFLYMGCTRVVVDALFTIGRHEVVSQTIADIINKEKCTTAVIFGRYFYDLLEGNVELGSQFPLKCMLISGYPLRESVSRIVPKVTRRFVNLYSCTDIGSISVKEIVPGCEFSDYDCGKPDYGVEVKIVDEKGSLCPRNEVGIIQARPRIHFPGYLNNPEKTAKAMRQGGWFHTDDAGYMTDSGEIFILGRQTDLIYISNARVAPCVVEAMIGKHPQVDTVVVVPIPDEVSFQQLCACIVLNSSSAKWEDIAEFLRNEILRHHGNNQLSDLMPRYHVFLESIPVTINGKVEKKKLTDNVLKMLKIT